MIIVRESINFDRSGDPFKNLGIGRRFLLLSKETGMTPEELRMTKGRLGSLFSRDVNYEDFLFWLNRMNGSPDDFSSDSPTLAEIVWALDHPKEAFELVKMDDDQTMLESVNNFERGGDSLKNLHIGKRHRIEKWLEEAHINSYNIDDDFRIWTKESIIMQDAKQFFPNGKLPEYIKFISTGDFDVDDNDLVSFAGFPEYVAGYFSCQMNKFSDLEGFPKEVVGPIYFYNNYGVKFTEDDIRSVCIARQNIENDFSDDV